MEVKIVRINYNDLIDLGVKEVFPKILAILKELPQIYDQNQKTESIQPAHQLYQKYQAVTNPTFETLGNLAKDIPPVSRRFEATIPLYRELQQFINTATHPATHPHSGLFDHDTAVPRLQIKIDQMVQAGWDLISVIPIYVPVQEGGVNKLTALDYYFKK